MLARTPKSVFFPIDAVRVGAAVVGALNFAVVSCKNESSQVMREAGGT